LIPENPVEEEDRRIRPIDPDALPVRDGAPYPVLVTALRPASEICVNMGLAIIVAIALS
jgi:hypothetical protein